MDDIIKSIIKKDYKSLEPIIAKPDLDVDYTVILHLFFYMYINNYINDDQAFIIFYLIIDKRISVKDVIYLYKFIPKSMINGKLFNFLKVKKDLICINMGVNEVINRLKGSDGLKKFDDLTIGSFYDRINNDLVKVISSFIDVSFIECTSSINIDKQRWMNIQEDEMVHRLSLLMNLLGHNVVSFMNVPIINNTTFQTFTFEDKVIYYKKCISNLINSINTLKEMSARQRKIECLNSSFEHQYTITVKNSPISINSIPKTSNNLASLIDRYFS
jgi:hypothetical protein